ncbi:MAG: LLM class flavin-dependent oxidoreductase, partial [Alphaproteobacteria bacterium]|nr:LLM class flavin-dependent oxidoreductase [Alphaproteobacteria bacterium]
FGVGKGYRAGEFSGFCVPMEEAEARFEEAVDVITRAWTSDVPFSHTGRFWRYENIVVEPPTAQRPHPPFWQGAGHALSIRRVAARGHGLLIDQFCSLDAVGERLALYRDAIETEGFGFDPARVAVARAFFVAHTEAERDEALERRLLAQRRLLAASAAPAGTPVSSIMAFSDTREASAESALYGRPDEIARKIERLGAMGVRYILLNGGGTSRENLRRFARQVMPLFS